MDTHFQELNAPPSSDATPEQKVIHRKSNPFGMVFVATLADREHAMIHCWKEDTMVRENSKTHRQQQPCISDRYPRERSAT